MTAISANSAWKKGGSFQRERFLLFFKSSMEGGGEVNPPPLRAYATAYMPLKETPIFLLLHCNRNDKNAVQATSQKLIYRYCYITIKSISILNKKVGWNRRNVGNFCKLEERANKRRII